MPSIEETINFIKTAFDNQLDKSGEPKYLHSVKVMEILPEGVSEEVKLAALLHDVPEDTGITVEALRKMGYSDLTCDIVEVLTHDKLEKKYLIHINNIVEDGIVHKPDVAGAILIKYADLCHNTSPGRMDKLDSAAKKKLSHKYHWPKMMLKLAVKALGYDDYDPYRADVRMR